MKFRKKPVVIEAFQTGQDGVPMPKWIMDAVRAGTVSIVADANTGQHLYADIKTLEGFMRADPGDWIIKGVAGELYPCKDDIFQATYEPVEG